MHRWPFLTLLACMVSARGLVAREADLPRHGPGEATLAEPNLLLNDLGDALPRGPLGEEASAGEAPAPDVERARAQYERAVRKRDRWEKLVPRILAPVEFEKAVAQAARARVLFTQALAAQRRREAESLHEQPAAADQGPEPAGATKSAEAAAGSTGDPAKSADAAAEAAQREAEEARAALEKLRLQQAQANLDRQQRLTALGAGSRKQLKRAQETLAAQKVKSP